MAFIPQEVKIVFGEELEKFPQFLTLKGYNQQLDQWEILINNYDLQSAYYYNQFLIKIDYSANKLRYKQYECLLSSSMGDYIALSELQITQPTSLQSQYYEQVNKLMQERNLEFSFQKETFYFLNYLDTYQFSFKTEIYQNQIKEQTIQQLPSGLTFDEQNFKFQGILDSKYKEKVLQIYITAKDKQNLEQTEQFEIDYTSIILAYFNFEEEGIIKNKAPNVQQQEEGSTNNLIYDNFDKSYEFSGQQNEYIDTNFSDFPASFSFFIKIKTTSTSDYVILATNQQCGENCSLEKEPGFTIFMQFGWWAVSVIDESGNSNTIFVDIIDDGQVHMIGFYTQTTKKITFYQDGVVKKNSPNCPFAYAHDCLGNCVNFLHMFSGQCQTGMLDYGNSNKIAYFDCPELNCIDNCNECKTYKIENSIKSQNTLKIGDYYQKLSTYFSGKILGIYIYNIQLSDNELQVLFSPQKCIVFKEPFQDIFDRKFNGILQTKIQQTLDLTDLFEMQCEYLLGEKLSFDRSLLQIQVHAGFSSENLAQIKNNLLYMYFDQYYFNQQIAVFLMGYYNNIETGIFDEFVALIKGKYDKNYEQVAIINGHYTDQLNLITINEISIGEINDITYIFIAKQQSQLEINQVSYVFNDIDFESIYQESISSDQQKYYSNKMYQIDDSFYLIVAFSTTNQNGILIYNVTNPNQPEIISEIINGLGLACETQIEIAKIDDIWYSLLKTDSAIFMLNINDPQNPQIINSSGFQITAYSFQYHIMYTEHYFIVSLGQDGIEIFKITDAQNGIFTSILRYQIIDPDDLQIYPVYKAKIFTKIIQDNSIISHFVTLVLDNIGFKIYNLYESTIIGFTLTEYYSYKNNGIQDLSLFIVGNIQYICLFGVNYGIDIYDVRIVEEPVFIQHFEYNGVQSIQLYENEFNKFLFIAQKSQERIIAVQLDLIYNNTQTNPYQSMLSQYNLENLQSSQNYNYYTQAVVHYTVNNEDFIATIVIEQISPQSTLSYYLEIYTMSSFYTIQNIYKHKYQQNTSSIGIIQRGSIMQYEIFGNQYVIVFRYEGIERLNIYDVTDSQNIYLLSTINGEKLPYGTKGFANIYKINGINYIFASDYDQIVVYDIFDIQNAYIIVRYKIGSNFINILQFEIYLSYYKYETYYLLTTTQYQTNIIQIYTSGMFVQIPTISIIYMEGIEQSQEFPNKYQYYDIEFSQGVFRYLHSDKLTLQDLLIISNHKGIYLFDITAIDQVYLLKYLDVQYAKSSLLSYMQIISMNLKTYLQVCSGEQGIIQLDISDPKNTQYLSQIDTKYAMHFQTIQKNGEYYNIIADQIGGIKISKIYQYGVYPVVTQQIVDGAKQFNIKLKIYQPSYFQPYYSTGKFKLLDIQVMEEYAELNTFTTTPNWMTINLDQQIISLKPSTKAELDTVNKIYYVYSLKIDQYELQEYVEAAYPSSSLDYEQLKLELISFGHITKNMFIQDYIGEDYNLQLSSQFDDYLEGITGFLKTKQFHGHMLANTDYITASNNPPVITCSDQYLKYELKSKQDTLCPQNEIQEQFDSQLLISLGLKIAKVGKYISFRFSEFTFYDYDKDSLSYSISNIKRTFENKTSIDGLYYTDISWLAFSGEDRILQGTPTTSYYNNILEISITASDGYDNNTALLIIDHSTIPPKYNTNVDTLQKQFSSQNPNPQVGQPIYFNFQNSIPFIDEDKDELKYLAYKFVKSQSKFISIHNLNKYDTVNYLSFNNYTLTFQGTVPKNYNKETEIYCVQAFDGYEYSDCQIFKIEYNDKAPKLKSKIGNQKVTVNQNFEFTIQSDSFEDEDKQLSITATQKDGSPLPEWLEFDSNSNTFYGTPEEIVNLEIQLTATDIEGKSVQTIFKIEVQYSIYYLGMQLYKYGGIFVGLIGLLGIWNYQNVFYNLFGKKRYRSYRKECLIIGETYYHKYIPMISKEYYNSCQLVWNIFLQKAQENDLKISNSLDLKDLIANNNQNIEPVFQALKPILVNPKNKISLKQVNKIIQETYTGKYSKDKLNTNFGVIIHHFLNHFRLQEDPETYEIYNLIKQKAQKQLITYANQKLTSPLDWYKEFIEILEKDIDEIEQNKFPSLTIKQLEIFDAVMEILDPDNKIIENTYKSEFLQFQNSQILNLQSQNLQNKNKQKNKLNNTDQETNNSNKKINFLLLKNAIISEAKMQETIIVGKSRLVNIVKALGIKRHPFFQTGFIRFLKNEQYNIEGHMNDPLPSWLQYEFLHKTAILLQGIPQSLEDQELILQIQDNNSFILREYLLEIKKPSNQKKIKLTKFNTFYTLKMSQQQKSQSVPLDRIQNNQITDHYLDKTKQPLMDASQQSYSNTTLEQIDEDIPKDQQNISNKNLIYQSRKQKQISKMEENFENISKISNRINLQNQMLSLSSNNLNAYENQLTNKNINTFDNQLLFDESNDTLRTNRYIHTQNQTQIDSISNLMSSKNAYENQNNQYIKINFNQDKKYIYPKLQNKQISIRIDEDINSKQQLQRLEQKRSNKQNYNSNDNQSSIIKEENKCQEQQINYNDDNYIVFDSTFSLKKNNSSYPKVKDQEQIDADQIIEEKEI